jgi:hypothetical protein
MVNSIGILCIIGTHVRGDGQVWLELCCSGVVGADAKRLVDIRAIGIQAKLV